MSVPHNAVVQPLLATSSLAPTGVLDAIDLALAALALVVASSITLRRALGVRSNQLLPVSANDHRIDEWTVAWGFGAYVFASLLLAALFLPVDPSLRDKTSELGVGTAAQLIGAGVCLILIGKRTSSGVRGFLWGIRPRRPGIARCLVVATLLSLGLCPLMLRLTVGTLQAVWPDFVPFSHPTLTALSGESIGPAATLLLWLGAAVIAPVSEEVFFRGFVQNAVRNATRSPRVAILAASVVFAAVHLSQPHALPTLLFLGVLLGWSYERTGILMVPVAVHAAFNVRTLVWQFLGADLG